MASIKLSELQVTGSELFQDSESFLNDMSDVDSMYGGGDAFSYGFGNAPTFVKLGSSGAVVVYNGNNWLSTWNFG